MSIVHQEKEMSIVQRVVSRGPLVPQLICVGDEIFSIFIDRAVRRASLLGCTIKGRNEDALNMSHLLFAYGTLVLCKDFEEQ